MSFSESEAKYLRHIKELQQTILDLKKQLKEKDEDIKLYKGVYDRIMSAPHPEYYE